MPTPPSTKDRAQVGIGTLIVFIAMILVAALSAAVLIHTVGVLQTQATATGEASTTQISTHVDVISATGTVGATGEHINETRMVTQPVAGSGDIDLSRATVQVLGPEGSSTLIADDGGGLEETSASAFGLEAVSGDTDTAVLQQRSDRIALVLDFEAIDAAGGDGLAAGQQVRLTITLQSGSQTTVVLHAPDVLAGKGAGDNVRL